MSLYAPTLARVNAEDEIPFGIEETSAARAGSTGGFIDEPVADPEPPVLDYVESGSEMDALRNELATARARIMGKAVGCSDVWVTRTHQQGHRGFRSEWSVTIFFGQTSDPDFHCYRAEGKDLTVVEAHALNQARREIVAATERMNGQMDAMLAAAETDNGPRAA